MAWLLEKAVLDETARLCPDSGRLLVCVSGGIDSVVLLDILHRGGWDIAVAHCNFSLRGEESDGDEQFVRKICDGLGVRCHVRKFDTEGYAKENGLNTQIAARELRYSYFEELRKEHGYSYIIIAHHLDDDIETFFINLIRGTGLKGISGISGTRDTIIRPMLHVTREEIAEYARKKGLAHREDRTNGEDHYLRNRIRHHVIPVLTGISPSFRRTMAENIGRFSEAADYMEECVASFRKKAEVSPMVFSTAVLKGSPHMGFLLFELLHPFGFNADVVAQLRRAMEEDARGKWFMGNGLYKALLERDFIRVIKTDGNCHAEERTIENSGSVPIGEIGDYRHAPSDIAYLDADKLEFPLTVRRWRAGDRIRPLGMKGSKTIGDFLADRKVSAADRDKVEVVVDSTGEVAWIVGIQVSESFKIDSDTKKVVQL